MMTYTNSCSLRGNRRPRRCSWWAVVALAVALLGLQQTAASAMGSVLVGKDGWLFPKWENLTKEDKPGIDATLRRIKQLNDLLAARHIGLVVMVVPMKAAFYPERLPAGLTISPAVKQRYGYILSGLKRDRITTFDLLPILRGVEHGSQTAFYRADYHWTAQAAEACADAAAQLIRSKWTLTGNKGTGTPLGPWIKERRYGDLAANFMSPSERASVGRDVYVVRDTAKHNALLATDPAPVEVVGNSFVLPYLGFTQKLSHDLDRPVGLAGKPGNVGPWATMLQFLQSSGFAKHPPQVILWQFNEAQLQFRPDSPGAWDAASNISSDAWLARVTKLVRQ